MFLLRMLAAGLALFGAGLLVHPLLAVLGLCVVMATPMLALGFGSLASAPVAIEVLDHGLFVDGPRRAETIAWTRIQRLTVVRRNGAPMSLGIELVDGGMSVNVSPYNAFELDSLVANATLRIG